MSLSCYYEFVLSKTNLIDGYVLIDFFFVLCSISIYSGFFLMNCFTIIVKFLYEHYTIAGPTKLKNSTEPF